MRQELRGHALDQHVAVMARRNITWTETASENTGAQELGSDMGSAASPNEEDMVTSAAPFVDVQFIPSLKIAPPNSSVPTTPVTSTTATVTTATRTESSPPAHEVTLPHLVTEVSPAPPSPQQPASGYKELGTGSTVAHITEPLVEGLHELADFTLTQGFEECARELRNMEECTPMQPQEEVVATPTDPTPSLLSPAFETARVVNPVVTSNVTANVVVGEGKKVDGEGSGAVREKAKRVSANDSRPKRPSQHETRPTQVPRTATTQSNKVDKQLQVLYRKLRYNIFCIQNLMCFCNHSFCNQSNENLVSRCRNEICAHPSICCFCQHNTWPNYYCTVHAGLNTF